MKLTLRKAEVVIIRKLINDRLEELRQGDATPNQLRVLGLIDKRIMRAGRIKQTKNEEIVWEQKNFKLARNRFIGFLLRVFV